jgi:uncharacterized membrane protein HdeD (DUF308 family)
MKAYTYAGIILIAAGIVALAYQGFAYTTEAIVVGLGPEYMTKERLPLPSIVGALALAGGIVLLAYGKQEGQRRVKAAQLRRWLI